MAILRNLRREWRTYLSQRLWILGVLLLALCALALVQYHWIEQVAQAEHQRAKTNLTTALLDLASDFDIEITRVFATFQLPAASPADYTERYKQWLGRAPYPGLVRGVYILETKKTPSALRAVIPGEPAIASNAWQPALTRLALPLGVVTAVDPPGSADGSQLSSQGAIVSIAGSSSLDTTIDGNPVFVFPIVPAMDQVTTLAANEVQGTAPAFATMAVEGERVVGPLPPFEWLVVVLEASYIRETLIPRLLQIHFPNGSLSDYDILVVSKKVFLPSRTIFHSPAAPPESRFGHPDGTVNLYALRMDCFVRSPPGDTGVAATRILQLGPRPGRPWLASSGAEIVRSGPQAQMPIGVDRLSEILAPTLPNCSQPAPASGADLAGSWEMLVRYRAGSLDQAMATFRRRSILMSCSVLLVLALGILMLVVLTERARSLAEMQAEFVLGVSHELRTPLTVIRLAADNLKKGMVEGPEKAQNYGEIIGTHAAETTLLTALAKFIPPEERILLIEDTAEIQLRHENLVRFEARREQNGTPAVSIRDLLKAALRHRPDRILLGEIRSGEAFDLLQLLNTGHSGTLSTIHASSAKQALARFTSCVLQSGVELPYRSVKTNIGDSLNVVAQIERRPGRRFVSEVLEINSYDPDADLFDFAAVYLAPPEHP